MSEKTPKVRLCTKITRGGRQLRVTFDGETAFVEIADTTTPLAVSMMLTAEDLHNFAQDLLCLAEQMKWN